RKDLPDWHKKRYLYADLLSRPRRPMREKGSTVKYDEFDFNNDEYENRLILEIWDFSLYSERWIQKECLNGISQRKNLNGFPVGKFMQIWKCEGEIQKKRRLVGKFDVLNSTAMRTQSVSLWMELRSKGKGEDFMDRK
ncbi:12632_t:CDS:2, partial [Acaulospora morrowiae]